MCQTWLPLLALLCGLEQVNLFLNLLINCWALSIPSILHHVFNHLALLLWIVPQTRAFNLLFFPLGAVSLCSLPWDSAFPGLTEIWNPGLQACPETRGHDLATWKHLLIWYLWFSFKDFAVSPFRKQKGINKNYYNWNIDKISRVIESALSPYPCCFVPRSLDASLKPQMPSVQFYFSG